MKLRGRWGLLTWYEYMIRKIIKKVIGDKNAISAGHRGEVGSMNTRGYIRLPTSVGRVAVISAKNHKRQSVTPKREKSQTPKVLTAMLTLPNLT